LSSPLAIQIASLQTAFHSLFLSGIPFFFRVFANITYLVFIIIFAYTTCIKTTSLTKSMPVFLERSLNKQMNCNAARKNASPKTAFYSLLSSGTPKNNITNKVDASTFITFCKQPFELQYCIKNFLISFFTVCGIITGKKLCCITSRGTIR
jgi:hypothetical protein